MTPKVSIVTVTFNAADLLENTLKSVQKQTFTDYEYVVVDGNSTDQTQTIIQQYSQLITTFISETDKGIYDAMNKGIALAKGQYLIFMNAGDVFANHHVLDEIFKQSDNQDFIYGNTLVINPDGSTKSWHKTTPKSNQLTPFSFARGMVICHQAMLVKRTIAPNYNLEYKIAADIDWCTQVLKKAKNTYYYNQPMILFLWGGTSDKRRNQALKERFFITLKHWGVLKTILAQFQIVTDVFKRLYK